MQVGTWLRRRLPLKGRTGAATIPLQLLLTYRKSMVRRQACCQRLCNGGLGMPDLESHWLAERQAFLGQSLTRDAV